MLELIEDNRSGHKLEVVVMTFNEQVRILNILSLYGAEFDVVILDGGSSDATCDLVREHGGTVYKRIGENIGENHFVHYVNNLSKSGRCFYMMCDEYADVAALRRASIVLAEPGGQVFGRRIDWFYGVRARTATCLLPKGFRRGDAVYSVDNFHDSLRYREKLPYSEIVDVQHLHVFSMRDDYGKFGHYIYHEVSQLRNSPATAMGFFVRMLKLGRALQLGIMRFPTKFWIILFLFFQFFASFFLFLMSLVEQAKLQTRDEQFQHYKNKYHEIEEVDQTKERKHEDI